MRREPREGRRLSPHEQAYKKAEAQINDARIKLEDFSDLFGAEVIRKDEAYVKRMKQIFRERSTTRDRVRAEKAAVIEAILDEQIDMAMWLGENCTTIKTTEYDDIKNGVDTVAEFSIENGQRYDHLALAMDVTYAHDPSKKFERIAGDIKEDRLATLKYFASEESDVRGELRNIPRLVLQLTSEQVDQMRDLWVSEDRATRNSIGTHPIRKQIMAQIQVQLEHYAHYAERINSPKAAQRYNNALELLSPVLAAEFPDGIDSYLEDNEFMARFEQAIENGFY